MIFVYPHGHSRSFLCFLRLDNPYVFMYIGNSEVVVAIGFTDEYNWCLVVDNISGECGYCSFFSVLISI